MFILLLLCLKKNQIQGEFFIRTLLNNFFKTDPVNVWEGDSDVNQGCSFTKKKKIKFERTVQILHRKELFPNSQMTLYINK